MSHASEWHVEPASCVTVGTTAKAVCEVHMPLLHPGYCTVAAEKAGFAKSAKKIHLDIGAAGSLDFALAPGQVIAQVEVQDVGELAEPTRTTASTVIDEQKIANWPVNGRQLIDCALLAPGVTIGD